ncbi:hypothetical protein V1498_11825 [Peribacillus sp. SCS-26]|uniref:hypothetical protein n=1 Tax=Paraperibacillus marinus TaxID=3115295 RepID=UPI00390636B5
MEGKKRYSKTYKYGNSTVIVHSDLLKLSEDESRQWFKREMAEGNPVLEDITRAVNACYRDNGEDRNGKTK